MINLKKYHDAVNIVNLYELDFADIGRKLYKMRNPDDIINSLYFHSVSKEIWRNNFYSKYDFDGIEWQNGEVFYSINFTDRRQDPVKVTIPSSWIEQDWVDLENKRLNKIKQLEDLKRQKEAVEKERRSRELYEQLKVKYGTSDR